LVLCAAAVAQMSVTGAVEVQRDSSTGFASKPAAAFAQDTNAREDPTSIKRASSSNGTDSGGGSWLRAFGTRHNILVWQMQLDARECTSYSASPCYNIYAINATSGELLWFAYR